MYYTKTAIFNLFLKKDPEYINIKDKNNILKTILLARPENYEIKLKFGKFQIMEEKKYFYRAQRHYYILLRFIQRCKVQKAKVFDIDCDLRMTPFDPVSKIQLLENQQMYTFNVYDLVNIIKTSLFQQNFMFAKPQHPKNPYTNLDFRVNNLYNIYIKCLELKLRLPVAITYFAECNFNIDLFAKKHRRELSDWAIDTYLSKDATVTINMVEDIYDMCYTNNIQLHSEFPKAEAFAIFRPYLKYYYAKKNVCILLECFELYNPFFGRKYQMPSGEIRFDNRHLSFSNDVLKNTKSFNRMNSSKYDYKNIYCVSLQPIEGVTYFEAEKLDGIDDNLFEVEYDDDDDENDP